MLALQEANLAERGGLLSARLAARPVCVAAEARGHGLARAMFATPPGREGNLFIRTDNTASLRAHAHIGMRPVATFEHDGVRMVVLAYVG